VAFGDAGELLVAGAFLIERLLQQARNLAIAKLPGKRAERAVAGDLIVLGPLRRCDERATKTASCESSTAIEAASCVRSLVISRIGCATLASGSETTYA